MIGKVCFRHVSTLLWKNMQLAKTRWQSFFYLLVPILMMKLIFSMRESTLPVKEFNVNDIWHSDFKSSSTLMKETIVLIPDMEFTRQIQRSIQAESSDFEVVVLPDEAALTSDYKQNLMVACVVKHADQQKQQLSYKEIMSNHPISFNAKSYLALQSKLFSTLTQKEIAFSNGILPEDPFPMGTSYFIAFSFLFLAGSVSSSLVDEKASRIREGLRIVGVSETSWMLSWAAYYWIPVILQAPVLAFSYLDLFPVGTSFPLFVMFLFFPLSVFAFSYMCSAFFDKPVLCQFLISFLFPVATAILFLFFRGSSSVVQAVASLFSPVALSLSLNTLFRQRSLELIGKLIDSPSLGNGVEWFGTLDIWSAVALVVLDTLLYLLIGSYLHRVVPSKFGPRLPWNFLFKRNPFKSRLPAFHSSSFVRPLLVNPLRFQRAPNGDDQFSGIRVRQLRKSFAGGQVVAVDGVDVDMFCGEVFALLGQNGAGKTTLIDMLTGIYVPDGGRAIINGQDISTQMNEIRNSMGLCPQQNILFDRLTVMQHLEFYARLKGSTTQTGATAFELISSLGLDKKVHSKAQDLSGGQKRKLSVAIAFIGGSRVVFLDEPSSGMDVESSRKLWDTIKKFKEGRIILLTTHELTEARLATRIGIMAQGKMQCSGSPLFLSRSYGIGYTLTVSRTISSTETQRDSLCRLVLDKVKGSTLLSQAAVETMFRLPFDEKMMLSTLFRSLDSSKDECGISTYSISSTTLDEVFLEVVHEAELNNCSEVVSNDDQHLLALSSTSGKLEGDGAPTHGISLWRQMLLMCQLRLWSVSRDSTIWVSVVLVPILYWLVLHLTNPEALLRPGEVKTLSVSSFYGDSHDPIIVHKGAEPNEWEFTAPSAAVPISAGTTEDFYYELAGVAAKDPRVRAAFDGEVLFVRSGHRCFTAMLYYNVLVDAQVRSESVSAQVFGSVETWRDSSTSRVVSVTTATLAFFLMGLFLMFVPPIVGSETVRLRTSKMQLQLLLAGGNLYVYWLSSILVGFGLLLLPTMLCLLVFHLIIGISASTTGLLVSLLVSFCLTSTSFVYLTTLCFNSEVNVALFVRIIFVVTGPVMYVADLGIQGLLGSSGSIKATPVLNAFPAYALFKGLLFLMFHDLDLPSSSPLSWVGTASRTSVIAMFVTAVIFTLLLLAIETIRFSPNLRMKFSLCNIFSTPQELSASERDLDVITEAERVASQEGGSDLIRVCGLSKVYKSAFSTAVNAVDRLSFGVGAGQCYGLLGTNGSGKTSTLNVLTGDSTPSSGSVLLKGVNVLDGASFLGIVGYCPQFDALIPYMSARAHLRLFGRLMGMPEEHLEREVKYLLADIGLGAFADRPAGTYSGGNKRKLSTALSLLGARPIVLLDEPSTGIDPISRRQLWNLIRAASSSPSRCVVLTTQNLEECEALCSRISIMVNGVMQCIGTSQHLKSKFGDRFQLSVNMRSTASLDAVKAFVYQQLKGSQLLEQYDTHLLFSISKSTVTLAEVFELLEENADEQSIEEYQIQETTLEQVFLGMADAAQRAPLEPANTYLSTAQTSVSFTQS